MTDNKKHALTGLAAALSVLFLINYEFSYRSMLADIIDEFVHKEADITKVTVVTNCLLLVIAWYSRVPAGSRIARTLSKLWSKV